MKIMSARWPVVLLAGAFGCASTQAQTAANEGAAQTARGGRPRGFRGACDEDDGAGGLRLLVQAARGRGGDRETLQSGDTVRSGERFHLRMCASRRAWVYLFQVDPRGRAEVLYPREGAGEEVEAREMVRVPTGDLDIIVDEQTGDEHLVVVASDRPVEESDPALAGALAGVRSESDREVPSPAPRRPRPHAAQRESAPPATDARPSGDVLTALHPRGLSRRLRIAPAEGEGAEVDETKTTSGVEHVVIWRLDLRHAP